ncbi:MAG TPA: hypothetical protein PLU10_05105, partial [Chitinophagaceae bacterium]|nr:hypothetical protein [Chitinophagaceae bacterium]
MIPIQFRQLVLFFVLTWICGAPSLLKAQYRKLDSLSQELKKPHSADEIFAIRRKLGTILNENDPKRALPFIDSSMQIVRSGNNRVHIGMIELQYANYYEKKGD